MRNHDGNYLLHMKEEGTVTNALQRKRVIAIVPAYNERDNIVSTIEDLRENASETDYIIVNDGSRDDTSAICHERGYSIIDLPVNLGLAGAFQTGMRYAFENGYDYAVQFDADGQHSAAYIGALISFMILLTTHKRIQDPTSGMRLFDKTTIPLFANELDFGPEPDTISLLMRWGYKVVETQVEMRERVAGESYLNFTKSVMYMLRMSVSILLVQWFRRKK